MEIVLALPLATAASATVVYGAPLVLGGTSVAASGASVGGKVIPFVRALRPAAAVATTFVATERLAAETNEAPPGLESLRPGDRFVFIYHPD